MFLKGGFQYLHQLPGTIVWLCKVVVVVVGGGVS